MLRILRVIEYTYETPERMVEDMARWQVGANATKYFGSETIKSAIILPEVVDG